MAIAYRYRSDNTIEQQDSDGVFRVHTLTDGGSLGNEKSLFDKQVARWRSIAADNETRSGVPQDVTLAIIFGESAGNPTLQGPASDHGLGLMMITSPSLKQGLSDDQVMVPENNIKLGTDALATDAQKLGAYDVVQLASMYNCGAGPNGPHTSSSAPWGFCEYKIPETGAYPYISKVVRAYNYAVQTHPSGFGGSSMIRTVLGVVLGVVALGGAALAGSYLANPESLVRAKRWVTG